MMEKMLKKSKKGVLSILTQVIVGIFIVSMIVILLVSATAQIRSSNIVTANSVGANVTTAIDTGVQTLTNFYGIIFIMAAIGVVLGILFLVLRGSGLHQ